MANTYSAIATVTVGSGGANSIQFAAIPGTYTDLVLLLSLRSSSASGDSNCFIYFNNTLGTAYETRRLLGSGSAASSDSFSSYPWVQALDKIPNATFTASTFANAMVYIPNYAGTTNKSVSVDIVSENNATAAQMGLDAALFTTSSAITQIDIDGTDNFVQYSTATLYGIKNS